MANFFYTNANGESQGPYNKEQIKELAANETILATTILKSDGGHTANASAWFPGLKFKQVPELEHAAQQWSPGLFDIGFTRFITNTWISIIWVLTIILTFLGCVGAMVYHAFNNAPPVLFIIIPIVSLLSLLSMRMLFEVTIVLFRIETHLRTIREQNENK